MYEQIGGLFGDYLMEVLRYRKRVILILAVSRRRVTVHRGISQYVALIHSYAE